MKPTTKDYAKLLEQVKDRPDHELIQTMLLRSLSQAVYHADNIGHFGLALEEYAHFKAASQVLAKKHEVRAQYFSKPKVELVYEDVTLNQDKTIQDIFLAFSKIMAEKQEEIRRNHTTIARDDYKIEDMMLIIEEAFGLKNELYLDELFTDAKDMNQVITLFLATLELIKIHRISVQQETIFGTITLRKEWTNE